MENAFGYNAICQSIPCLLFNREAIFYTACKTPSPVYKPTQNSLRTCISPGRHLWAGHPGQPNTGATNRFYLAVLAYPDNAQMTPKRAALRVVNVLATF